mmetsp:Transcript_24999/g.35242  ORF Transcript_24999/g.35242 Transcript_24999/m.35242 type:complete len:192 (+) Transcript_24999:44-619(+)
MVLSLSQSPQVFPLRQKKNFLAALWPKRWQSIHHKRKKPKKAKPDPSADRWAENFSLAKQLSYSAATNSSSSFAGGQVARWVTISEASSSSQEPSTSSSSSSSAGPSTPHFSPTAEVFDELKSQLKAVVKKSYHLYDYQLASLAWMVDLEKRVQAGQVLQLDSDADMRWHHCAVQINSDSSDSALHIDKIS